MEGDKEDDPESDQHVWCDHRCDQQVNTIRSTKTHSQSSFSPSKGVVVKRVYLLYHTKEQVIVGAIVGTVVGITCCTAERFVLQPHVNPMIVQSWIGRMLCLKDNLLREDVLKEEYEMALEGRKEKTTNKKKKE